jgi:hypothetical protein
MRVFFLICSDGDVLSFDSVESLIAHTESPDVENGEYFGAFDSAGTPLRLVLARPTERLTFLAIKTLGLTPVTVEASVVTEQSREELKQHLLRALGEKDSSVPLEDLIRDAAKKLKSDA